MLNDLYKVPLWDFFCIPQEHSVSINASTWIKIHFDSNFFLMWYGREPWTAILKWTQWDDWKDSALIHSVIFMSIS
jgi:hypothetical protein